MARVLRAGALNHRALVQMQFEIIFITYCFLAFPVAFPHLSHFFMEYILNNNK
jgi:hypothetical protein